MLVQELALERSIVPAREAECEPPLCVDLDGTLIAGDLLWESVAALARTRPWLLLLLPFWLLAGKAYLKQQLASRTRLAVEALPYRSEVLALVRRARADGRHVVLATASNEKFAQAVADHLGLFDEVLASSDTNNLKGANKTAVLTSRYGTAGFDYVGDSEADLPVWAKARASYLVCPSRRLLDKSGHAGSRTIVAPRRPTWRAAAKLLRPHQWAKNLLLFVPLVLSHRVLELPSFGLTVLAFVAFSLSASAVYVLNDLLDLEADRRHPTKRNRPLASGALPIPTGVLLGFGCAACGMGTALAALPWSFCGLLAVYLVLTTAYSIRLKREPILDVFVLAGLYTLRILAGGAAIAEPITGWLLAFSLFFFVSLALVKRYSELLRVMTTRPKQEGGELDRRGYHVDDLGLIQTIGPASGYLAVLTFCLYVNAPDVFRLYTYPQMLWGVGMVLFYWITRVWFLARRQQLTEDPVTFAIRDPLSILLGVSVLVGLVLAA